MAAGGERTTRRGFLEEAARSIFPHNSLDKGGCALQARISTSPSEGLHVISPHIPASLAGPAVYPPPAPPPLGIRDCINLLPTKETGEDLMHLIGDSFAPIGAAVLGFAGGYIAGSTAADLQNPGSRRGFLGGIGGGVFVATTGAGIFLQGEPNYRNFDTVAFTRTSAADHPLARTPNSLFPHERTPNAPALIAKLQQAISEIKPDVSLHRTPVYYNRTVNAKTGFAFEIALVQVGKQTDCMEVNQQARLVPQNVYMVAYIDGSGEAVAKVAVASEISDQAYGVRSLILTLADENTLEPDFKRPLIQMTKWQSENFVRHGYYNLNTHRLESVARAMLPDGNNGDDVLSFIASLFSVPVAEAAELIPTATPTTKPTVIATATQTVNLEPTRAASPTPTPFPTYPPEQVGLAGIQKIENRSEWQTAAKSAIEQYAKTFGIDPNSVKLTIKGYTDKSGNQYALGQTADGTALMIWNKNEKGEWGWRKTRLQDSGFPVGNLLDSTVFNNTRTRQLYNEFNVASLDYDFHWFNTEPQKGNTVFNRQPGRSSDAETFTDFATEKGMIIYGGSLIFPGGYPKWLKIGEFSRDELISIVKNRITTTMQHFQGKIKIWSVMNEFHPADKDILKDALGDDLIDIAFQTAREADPSAILLYNDKDNHAINMIPDGYLIPNTKRVVDRLKAKGLIDGVGLQMHINGARPPSKQAVIDTMKGYGLPVYVTEFDVNMKDVPGDESQRNTVQAKIYQDMIEASRESGVCRAFILYGIGDKFSWIERNTTYSKYSTAGDPTPFDDNLQPKAAYFAMLRALFK